MNTKTCSFVILSLFLVMLNSLSRLVGTVKHLIDSSLSLRVTKGRMKTMSESQIKQINPVRYLIKRVNYIKEQLSNGVNMITQKNTYRTHYFLRHCEQRVGLQTFGKLSGLEAKQTFRKLSPLSSSFVTRMFTLSPVPAKLCLVGKTSHRQNPQGLTKLKSQQNLEGLTKRHCEECNDEATKRSVLCDFARKNKYRTT
jgi:hypothetical protein